MKISRRVLQPYRFLFFFGLISLAFLLFVEPYTRNYSENTQANLLSGLLAVWLVLSLLVFITNLPRITKDIGVLVGLVTLFVLIIRVFFSGNFFYELLPISYSMIFICSAITTSKFHIKTDEYRRIILTFLWASCVAFVYANSLALGIVLDYEVSSGEQRFSFFYDSNTAVVSIVIAMTAYSYLPKLKTKLLSCVVVALALMRLLSFGSMGPLAISILIIALMYVSYPPKTNRLEGFLLMLGILGAALFAASRSPVSVSYLDILVTRFDNFDTWNARLSEAANDFNAFLERPILGWGRNIPGLNVLDEPSSGHITPTGMLARLGLIGTLGLTFYYVNYFVKLKRYIRYKVNNIMEIQAVFLGITIFVIFLLVLGNPLFLFPAWAFLPLLFPYIDSRGR